MLLVTLDQWRGDCLGVAGHPVVQTPALDRLAHQGTWFTNHWASTAPCGPSRASLLTGLYAMNHRAVINGTPLKPGLTNVALEARAAGYDPVLFGYTDTSPDPSTLAPDDPRLRRYEGVLPGFRAVVDFPFETLAPWLTWLAEQGYDVDLDDPYAIYRGVQPGQPARYRAEHSESAFLTDEIVRWLQDEAGTEGPGWFVHAAYIRPHPPYQVAAPYHERYDPADVSLPVRAATREQEGEQHRLARLAVNLRAVRSPATDDELRRLMATYYAMVTEVDDQLGRLLAWLDDSGQAEDTLVVVTSDHGEQMGEHWLIEKLGYWDASYAVPLIIRDPRVGPTSPVARITEHVDVMPTVLDWMGIDVPVSVDGRSLLPLVATDGADTEWRTEAHWEWDFRDPVTHRAEDMLGVPMQHCGMAVLRGERFKYVHFAADELPDLLFDLDDDPDQLHDRAADPAYAAIRAELAGRMLSWRMRHTERALTDTVITPDGPRTRHDPWSGS